MGKKYSIRKARMISNKNYKRLLSKKRMTKKEKTQLDRALFVKYCRCVKKLKYTNKKKQRGREYPICINSIYKKRHKKVPKELQKKCSKYY
jgi:hypothetical protein|tara:strand:- start:1805 stop:2077 length:273 start_codon:yes stop_codon:yes gene_type:complete